MSYRFHAAALTAALTLLALPLPAFAQRAGGAPAQGAERVHVVRRLNTAYRFTPPVRTVDALKRTMSRANTQRDIGTLLQQDVPVATLAGILFVKFSIWAVALGSGTSGGVLAPLLMVGEALGGLEAQVFPAMGPGFWPLVSMAAILGGTMRTPFTAVVFALELTHDFNMVLPLLVAVTIAYALTVLGVRRSILTEKIARRGYHLTREYATDPLEIVFVREVMQPLDAPGIGTPPAGPGTFAYPDEPLRAVAYRMAATGATWLPVVDPDSGGAAVGAITLGNLLQGRMQVLEAEQRRERVLTFRMPLPAWVWERSGEL